MDSFLIPIVVAGALVVSLALTPVARAVGLRFSIVAQPGPLSIHCGMIPRTGGLAILGSVWVAAALAVLGGAVESMAFSGILVATTVAFVGGLLDDLRMVSPLGKLIFLLVAASLAAYLGPQVSLALGFWPGIALTVFCLVGGANAVNLIDGMDGVAAATTATVALSLGVMAFIQGNTLALVLCLALAGSSVGFLRHNVHPASVFLGDAGSLFLGFTLTLIVILLSSKGDSLSWVVAPLLAFGIPILDTSASILRRLLNRKSVFEGDRRHSYDILRSRLGYGRALAVFYGVSSCLGATGVLIATGSNLGYILGSIEVMLLVAMGLSWGLLSYKSEPRSGIEEIRR